MEPLTRRSHQRFTVVPEKPRCPVSQDRPSYCPRPPGFGTDHPGTGLCRQHELAAAAAAARATARKNIPQAYFQEPVYVDGLPYQDTAPSSVPSPATWDDDEDEPVAAGSRPAHGFVTPQYA